MREKGEDEREMRMLGWDGLDSRGENQQGDGQAGSGDGVCGGWLSHGGQGCMGGRKIKADSKEEG